MMEVVIPVSVVKADFCQSASRFSENSRGRQCMTNCFMFFIHTCLKQVSSFDKNDLHLVLNSGDMLYNKLRAINKITEIFLQFSDLPKLVKYRLKYFTFNFLSNCDFGFMSEKNSTGLPVGISLENSLNSIFSKYRMCIVIFHSAAIAIQYEQNCYYIFDSHSRGINALCHPEGQCVLSILHTFQDLCSFLRKLCLSLSTTSLEIVQYEACGFRIKNVLKKPVGKTAVFVNDEIYSEHSDELNNTNNLFYDHNFISKKRKIDEANGAHETFHSSKKCAYILPDKPGNTVLQNSVKKVFSKDKDMVCTNPCMEKAIEKCILKFKKEVCDGPSYICSCCTQIWFKGSVVKAHSLKNRSALAKSCLIGIKSKDDIEWICKTCDENIKANKVPSCAVINGMGFPDKPSELEITEMEERLITPRIPFMQLVEKPRGGQKSLRGNIVNVPTDVSSTVAMLPRTLTNTETIQVKLKRKKSYKHSVMYEAIRPNKCINALKYLLATSELFQNEGIQINLNWNTSEQNEWYNFEQYNGKNTDVQSKKSKENDIDESVIHLHGNEVAKEETNVLHSSETFIVEPFLGSENTVKKEIDVEEQGDNTNNSDESDGWTEDPNFENRLTGNTDTLLHPVDVRAFNKNFSFAPGEGQTPLGIYQDENAEYLAFPTIYCGKKRPKNKERKTRVYYSTICKWELRCIDRRAACSIPNIFFKLKKLQIKQIQDKVALAMRKCQNNGKKATVADVLNPTSFDNIVRLNEGYRVLKTLRGSPAYWECAKKDIYAMIKQLGIPTWFCSLSAAETRWKSLLGILGKILHNKDYTENELNSLSWIQKCELIKADPVTCSRYFNHRVQVFISTVLKSQLQPLGKVKDFFYRVEFQQRGSPHIHMLVWIENAPVYGQSEIQCLSQFIDCHSTCRQNSGIAELINYQTHRHARTCRKKGKAICRFNFPLPPMPETRILEPLEESEYDIYPNLSKNYEKISEILNQMKSGEEMSFTDFLEKLGMSEEMYLCAIRSSLKSPKLFLKRQTSEIRINSYNELLLKSWEANIDVQFILDGYACAAYIVSYISKSQRGMSNLLFEACREARKGSLNIKEQVRQIGNKFLTHVEVCAQEAAYLILQMPLRMSTRTVVFINTSEPHERTFLLKPLDILEQLPENSTDIESDNSIKRYQRRPRALNNCCLADFISRFDVIFPPKDKINQKTDQSEHLPEDENGEVDEDVEYTDEKESIETTELQDDAIKNVKEYLMKDGSIIKSRKIQKIIRYVRYNKDHDPENFFREQLMLFFPWRNETKDLKGKFGTYQAHYISQIHIIQENKKGYELDNGISDIIQNCEHGFDEDSIVCPEVQHSEEVDLHEQENVAVLHGCFDPKVLGYNYDLSLDLGITKKQLCTNDTMMNHFTYPNYMNLVRSLNEKQKIFFYHVLHQIKTGDLPFYYFLTGGAGVGKSVVITALYQAICRFYVKCIADCPDEIKVVLCAPTGKAAHNIGGNTIHSLFCIPANQNLKFKSLDVQQLDRLRIKFRYLKVIFIDEISMVGNKMFNFINLRLQEIFGCNIIFGGVSIIAVGDLFQLKPVFDSWIFDDLREGYGPLAINLWTYLFQTFELTEIMRQKEDKDFAEMLNRLREGIHTDADVQKLKSRVISPEDDDCDSHLVSDIPHLFTTNKEVIMHNTQAYKMASKNCKCNVEAIDTLSGDVSHDVRQKILDKIPDDPSKTMGLLKYLLLVENLPSEICINIDVEDGLTNGTPCIVKKLDFRVKDSQRCSIVWVLFEESDIGSSTRMKYCHLYTPFTCKTWTPIIEVTRNFTVGMHRSFFATRRQFPLRLACAKTIHKSQGSTMPKIVLDFGKRRNDHMHYVGLSRVRKLDDVHILQLNEKKISTSLPVIQEMVRLRENSYLISCLPILKNIKDDIKIVYHNVRSLHLHIDDVLADKNVISADIIAISESRLTATDSDQKYKIPGFFLYRFDDKRINNYERPYRGIAVYSKLELFEIKYEKVFDIETVFASFNHRGMVNQVIFFYCSPQKSNISDFCKYLQYLLDILDSSKPIILMGDTNIDFFSQTCLNVFIKKKMIRQLMHSCTTDYGSCLDHIYTTYYSSSDISCATLECYYSDHKPIIAYLPLNKEKVETG